MPSSWSRGRIALFLLGLVAFLVGMMFFGFESQEPRAGNGGEAELFQTYGLSFTFLGLAFMGIPALLSIRSRTGQVTLEARSAPLNIDTALPREVILLRCRGCGHLSPEESRFCGGCAKPL